MKRKILCISGPTGTGKSAVAIRIAKRLQGGIINCDSRQVYTDFPLITAQPSPEEQMACPHVLYGFLPTDERISAGGWSELCRPFLAHFALPVLVGGTGLYYRALFEGIVNIPDVSDTLQDELLAAYAAGEPLHAQLEAIDPHYAAKIHPNDRQRVVRALAVFQCTGKTFSWWHTQTPPPPDFDILRLGLKLPLSELEPFLAQRIDAMLEQGALDEARRAFSRCPDAAAPGWTGIGCREVLAHLQGKISLDECRTLWVKNTRAYAKRQLTWFNADKRILWFSPQEKEELVHTAERWALSTEA